MDIQIDSREKARAITKIVKTFDECGVKHFSSKLMVGDYMSLDNPRLIVDRKQNLQELCGNVCQQHERFKRELIKAIDAGIHLSYWWSMAETHLLRRCVFLEKSKKT